MFDDDLSHVRTDSFFFLSSLSPENHLSETHEERHFENEFHLFNKRTCQMQMMIVEGHKW